MRLRRLKRLEEEVEQQAKVDPELEKELAQGVYEWEEFNQQFNETDTEMLLEQMDVDVDFNKIRVDEVHKRAKSAIKINLWIDHSVDGLTPANKIDSPMIPF
jgi:cytochrome c-type biogenesis protein CcmH/NrfG